MKKLSFLIFSFLFVSCFTEPKKSEENITKTAINKVKDKNLKVIDTTKNSQVGVNTDTIQIIKKVNKNKICIENLINILNASADEFENFAIENNYYFDKIENYEYFKVLCYAKSDSFISFAVDKLDNTPMGMISLETNSKSLYLSMKDESLGLGFKFTETKTFAKEVSDKERLYSNYTNGKYNLDFIISNAPNNLGYSIAIRKKQ